MEQARPWWIPATVLLREIRERGYTGGISQLKVWLAPMKKREAEVVVRFETAPGKQMQVDFTEVRRGRHRLLAFVATMGYSRASFVKFTEKEDTEALCEGLREAFDYFGGVPEQVLFDNTKCVVVERDAYGLGRHRWNERLKELAELCGFTPKLCRPYRAKTKGKVERFHGYLKGSFFRPLAASLAAAGLVLDAAAANVSVRRWLEEVANLRVHGTTDAIPAQRLVEERAAMLRPPPLVAKPAALPRVVLPVESLQHPLAVYDQLLEAMP